MLKAGFINVIGFFSDIKYNIRLTMFGFQMWAPRSKYCWLWLQISYLAKQLFSYILRPQKFAKSPFDHYYIGQIYGGDFTEMCGLLRIYELYQKHLYPEYGQFVTWTFSTYHPEWTFYYYGLFTILHIDRFN